MPTIDSFRFQPASQPAIADIADKASEPRDICLAAKSEAVRGT